ncbi:hypothetical protein CHS0354_038177 [Potamilus streckersoni]|uniref:[acyl-carrier-protein] S-malonyltransferase n=1 Tax=Potamilus streckersoni TaxID=2493646 RepID=A0AAE0T1S6_9BIVA|nr:hypothetical protein CHS0354_038177 [Potamilus streckersoni]
MFLNNFAKFYARTNQFIRPKVSACPRKNVVILLKTDFCNITDKRACSHSSKTDNIASDYNNNGFEKSDSEPTISRRMQRRRRNKLEVESHKDITSDNSQTVIQTSGRRLRVSNPSTDSVRVKELQSAIDTMSARDISEETLDFPSDFEDYNKWKRDQSRRAYRPKVNPALTSILLFPGQGSQYIGMGKKLLPYHGVQEMYNKASAILGYDLLNLCLNGPQTELNRTVVCQPAVMVTSLAALEVLKATDPEALEQVVGTAGFSVGEYAALVSADVFSFEDAVEVVKIRAEAMQKLTEELASGMMTVFCNHQTRLNFAMEAAREHCKRNLQFPDPVCQTANYLCTDVKVIAGNMEALKFIEEHKSEFGIRRLKWLPVSGAFHTPLMKEAGKKLQQVLMKIELREPKIPVHSNVHGGRYRDTEQIRKCLSQQVYKAVKWEQILHILFSREKGENFPRVFEFGPSNQLGLLLKQTNTQAFNSYKNIEA